MNYIALGKQIRKQRQNLGLTQEKLAAHADISASFLGHIERGSRKASLETLINLANVLNIGLDALLQDSLTYVLSEYDAETRHLPSELRNALSTIIRVFNDEIH